MLQKVHYYMRLWRNNVSLYRVCQMLNWCTFHLLLCVIFSLFKLLTNNNFWYKKKQIPSASQLKHSINFNVNNGQIVQQNQNLYMFSFTLWFAAVLANWYIPQKQFITWLYVICIVFRQWNMGQTEYII